MFGFEYVSVFNAASKHTSQTVRLACALPRDKEGTIDRLEFDAGKGTEKDAFERWRLKSACGASRVRPFRS